MRIFEKIQSSKAGFVEFNVLTARNSHRKQQKSMIIKNENETKPMTRGEGNGKVWQEP